MSGPPPSRTPKEKVDEFAEQVEEYSRVLGLLPPAAQATRVHDYLELEPEDYDDMGDEDLTKVLLDVMAFAHKLQEKVNAQQVKADRCRFVVSKIVEGRLSRYDAFKHEDKRLQATLDDDKALAYYEVQKNCECFVRRWEWMVQRLDNYAKAVERMVYKKGN